MGKNNSKKKVNIQPFSRRKFVNIASASVGGFLIPGTLSNVFSDSNIAPSGEYANFYENNISLIGVYGQWASSLMKGNLPAFSFASRRVMIQDVPTHLRQGLNDNDPENSDNIIAYNKWAGEHEHIMAKSLFSAGTTWPGVFFAEDQKALDVLCARKDVDANRIGCGGLSGGGMRTVFMGGLDSRITCTSSNTRTE